MGEEVDLFWGEFGGFWIRGLFFSREGFVIRVLVRGCCFWKR